MMANKIKVSLSYILFTIVILLGTVPLVMMNAIVNKSAKTNIIDNRSEITTSLLDQSQKYLNLFLDELNDMYYHLEKNKEILIDLDKNKEQLLELKQNYAENSHIIIINLTRNKDGILISKNDTVSTLGRTVKNNLLSSQQGQLLIENNSRSLWLGTTPKGIYNLPDSIWNYRFIESQNESFIIISSINDKKLNEFVTSLEDSIKSKVRLITSDNEIYPRDNNYFDYTFAPKTLSKSNKGRFIQFSADNLLVHVYSDPEYYYNLVVLTPKDYLYRVYDRISATTTISFILLSLLSLLIGLITIYFMKKRITELIISLKGVAQGEYRVKEPTGFIRIKEDAILSDGIISAYNEVENKRRKLKNINENLEKIVDERTKELDTTKANLINAEKMATLGQSAAKLTHEINNTIGIAITASTHLTSCIKELQNRFNTGLLTKTYLNEFTISNLETTTMIEDNLNRAAELSNNFKNFASDHSSSEKRVLDLKDYLKEIIKSFNYTLENTGYVITLKCEEHIKIETYPTVIYQTITNLINNSILHGFDNRKTGTIEIEVKNKNENTIILVKDDGVGISFENQSKLFTPYFTTKKGYGGTGLGLNIIKDLVINKLKGNLTFQSTLGKGTCFTITIPKGK